MSSGIIELRKKLETKYDTLNGKYEGYIQMSDKRIEHIWTKASELPPLKELYVDKDGNATNVNYVLEMALFDPSTKQSILVRQHNADFLVLDKTLSDEQIKKSVSYYTATNDTPKMKLAQVWEAKKNEFCNIWDVEEATMLLFAGFESIESKGGKS